MVGIMANKATMGMSKHRKSGKSVNSSNFTGKKKSSSKKKQKLTRKQKLAKRRTHKNKYAHLIKK